MNKHTVIIRFFIIFASLLSFHAQARPACEIVVNAEEGLFEIRTKYNDVYARAISQTEILDAAADAVAARECPKFSYTCQASEVAVSATPSVPKPVHFRQGGGSAPTPPAAPAETREIVLVNADGLQLKFDKEFPEEPPMESLVRRGVCR